MEVQNGNAGTNVIEILVFTHSNISFYIRLLKGALSIFSIYNT